MDHDPPEIRAFIMGHSFIRRLSDYVALLAGEPDGRPRGEQFAEALEVQNIISQVAFGFFPKLGSAEMVDTLVQLQMFRPQILIIDVGSNDCTGPGVHANLVADQVYALATELLLIDSIEKICVIRMLRRDRHIGCHPAEFLDRVELFNDTLRSHRDDHPDIDIYYLQGFSRLPCGAVMPIRFFALDGIHPGPSFGHWAFFKYACEIRGRLLRLRHSLQD